MPGDADAPVNRSASEVSINRMKVAECGAVGFCAWQSLRAWRALTLDVDGGKIV